MLHDRGGSPHLCERHTVVLSKLAGYLQASKHEDNEADWKCQGCDVIRHAGRNAPCDNAVCCKGCCALLLPVAPVLFSLDSFRGVQLSERYVMACVARADSNRVIIVQNHCMRR